VYGAILEYPFLFSRFLSYASAEASTLRKDWRSAKTALSRFTASRHMSSNACVSKHGARFFYTKPGSSEKCTLFVYGSKEGKLLLA